MRNPFVSHAAVTYRLPQSSTAQVSAHRGGVDVHDVHAGGGDRLSQPARRHHDQRVHRGKERRRGQCAVLTNTV